MTSALHERFRRQAVEWARGLFALPRFLIIDSETTGLGSDDELCSIGIIDGSGNTILDSLIKPTRPIPWNVTRIHGITDRHVADAPTFADLYPQIAELLANEVVVVYNLSFDRRMLAQSGALHRLPAFRYREVHCAMLEYAKFHGEWNYSRGGYRWHKLADACGYCDIKAVNTHSAVGDSLLTLQLIRHIAASKD
jgi:DNA polymerase-3 subunit epsilon